MSLRKKRSPRPAPSATEVVVRRSPWDDGLGRLATRSVQLIAVAILAAGIVWGLHSLTLVVIPVLLALILASAFAPLMAGLRRRGVPDVLATVIVLLAVVVVLVGIGWLITIAVRSQWGELSDSAVQGFQQLVDWVNSLQVPAIQDQLEEAIDNAVQAVTDFVTSSQFGTAATSSVSAVANFLTGFVLLIVVLFFFLKDGPRLWAFLLRPFEGRWHARAERAGRRTVETLGSYIRGTASVAAVDAIGIWIGLAILQVPLAIPLAVLVFVLAFVPIVGATAAGILAALVALVANGPLNAVLVVAVVVLVNQLEGNFLQPVLMGRALKLHSLVILIALTIGTVVGGILGAILSVPIAAVAWGIVQVWDGEDLPARWARRSPAEEA